MGTEVLEVAEEILVSIFLKNKQSGGNMVIKGNCICIRCKKPFIREEGLFRICKECIKPRGGSRRGLHNGRAYWENL